MADEDRNPIEDLVDLFLYAPVGLLYEYENVLPELVKRGKSQVQLAKVLGTMAVRGQGTPPANVVVEAVASMVVNRISEIGASMGLTPPTTGSAGTDRRSESAAGTEDAGAPAPAGEVEGSEQPAQADDRPLPIATYDSLTAREIIGLLDELDEGQLARIRAHEEANRARKTVLGKLDRLSS